MRSSRSAGGAGTGLGRTSGELGTGAGDGEQRFPTLRFQESKGWD